MSTRESDHPAWLRAIYGLQLRGTEEVRYVGLTTKGIERRLRAHFKTARSGRKTPLYDWIRKHGEGHVEAVLLEEVTGSHELLGRAEQRWIAHFRAKGAQLLNLTDGGHGGLGYRWTDAQRAKLRGRPVSRVSLPGELNPMYGRQHTDEQKAKWRLQRAGTNSGPSNPNFGKFGPEHPSYGRVLSEATRHTLSEQKLGIKNPNFGKSPSPETRQKMSAARKGRPMPSSVKNAHTRHHTNKNIYNGNCRWCVQTQHGNHLTPTPNCPDCS